MKDKRVFIYIGSAVLVVAIGLIVTLVVINTRSKREPATSEQISVVRLDIPSDGDNKADVVDDSNDVEKTKVEVGQKNDKEKVDTKNNKDNKTENKGIQKDMAVNDTQKTESKTAEVIVEPQKEDQKISTPQTNNGTGSLKPGTEIMAKDDDVIELPFVPYEDLKEN